MTKQKPESFIGTKFSFNIKKEGNGGEIVKEEIDIPITNIYYDNADKFQSDSEGYLYLINSNYLSEEINSQKSRIYYKYILKENDAKALDLGYESYDMIMKDLRSDTIDLFIFLKTYSIVFIIMLFVVFCLFVFIFNNNIKNSFIVRRLIGGNDKYIKNLKSIYI